MHLSSVAEKWPDKKALIVEDRALTYAELEQRSNALAHAFRAAGTVPSDVIATVLPNTAVAAEIWWACMRSGLYYSPVNWHLTPDEIRWQVADSGASLLLHDGSCAAVVAEAVRGLGVVPVAIDGDPLPGGVAYPDFVAGRPLTPIADELVGGPMFYSSGTTGRPKGVRPALAGEHPGEAPIFAHRIMEQFGLTSHDTYLCTGPLYHSAPASWTFGMHTVGGTSVVMPTFDAANALELIDTARVTVSQWVPTMFTRLLRLPEADRRRWSLATHRRAFHAAAPCPVEVKRRMIEWWGPILTEYYAATEGGATVIESEEWLARPGSVGRHWTGGKIWILDPDTHEEMPAGQAGLVYFRPFSENRFEYHNDPAKTAEVFHQGLVTPGDIGYLDSEGYLFLVDRLSETIICGGVNVYPREVEDVLLGHPAVLDTAVVGVPDVEYGEQVRAVVVVDESVSTPALDQELIDYCRQHLSKFKCPRAVDRVDELPRDPNGKLYKRRLRDRYWQGRPSVLV